MEILNVKNLSFSYAGTKQQKPALNDISFSLQEGSVNVLCGATGCGKTTLLRLMKLELAPMGERSGIITMDGKRQESFSDREAAAFAGYVMQNPEQQIVCDKVWHELVFGLENLGVKPLTIRLRVAEVVDYFNIGDWYSRDVAELSGGQKQLLNLASVMVMQPRLLILDEPTAQLDPIAAAEFWQMIWRLQRETGITVLLAEHRLEDVIAAADQLLVMDRGTILRAGTPQEVCAWMRGQTKCRTESASDHNGLSDEKRNSEVCEALLQAMPASVRLYSRFDYNDLCPLSVSSGRNWLKSHFGNSVRSLEQADQAEDKHTGDRKEQYALEMHGVFFRYSRERQDVLPGTDLNIKQQEIFCLMGGNGSGKTTLLNAAAGLIRPYSGKIKIFGRKIKEYRDLSLYSNCLAMLPQDVQTVFRYMTVKEELAAAGCEDGRIKSGRYPDLPFSFTSMLDQHPYDLSGGEQQKLALARVVMSEPELLLLDEPTKGLDFAARMELARWLRLSARRGLTVLAVTHDVEFAAACADRCGLLFRGELIACDTSGRFFMEGGCYTTAFRRLTRGYYDGIIDLDQAEKICRLNEK